MELNFGEKVELILERGTYLIFNLLINRYLRGFPRLQLTSIPFQNYCVNLIS